jgi:VWFA-related protein
VLFAAHAPTQAPAQGPTQPAPQAAPAAAAPAAGIPVSLPVTVVDKKGDPIKNLAAGDITLTDNGHIQTISAFGLAQPTPITFGLIGQTSTNLKTELGDERLSSIHFVDHTLPGTDDKVFVVQFAKEVDLLEDPTATVNKLHDALNQLGSPSNSAIRSSSSGDSSDQSSGQHPSGGGSGGGTLYDAIYLASTEVLKKQPGQHVIILITDGIDRDSKETVNDAIEAAQAAHAAIFAIYYKGEEEKHQCQSRQQPARRNGWQWYSRRRRLPRRGRRLSWRRRWPTRRQTDSLRSTAHRWQTDPRAHLFSDRRIHGRRQEGQSRRILRQTPGPAEESVHTHLHAG